MRSHGRGWERRGVGGGEWSGVEGRGGEGAFKGIMTVMYISTEEKRQAVAVADMCGLPPRPVR